MATSELRKKTVFLLLSIAIITLVLIIIPTDETLAEYLNQAGMFSAPGSMPSQVAETVKNLIFHLAHIVKIILWMAIVIIFVRYLKYLIFHLALRNTSQNEISSLLKTVLSIVVCIVAFFIIFQSQYPRIELAPLFTGSTILGIVVGLALQDTLGNLFAGIALQADDIADLKRLVGLERDSGEKISQSILQR